LTALFFQALAAQLSCKGSQALSGRARRVHLLIAGTTFPQATRSCRAEVGIAYADGTAQRIELRSPGTWWPVEQDYLVDDYVFRMEEPHDPAVSVSWRVDLQTAAARATAPLRQPGMRGGKIPGGSAFVVSVETNSAKELKAIELHTRMYGVVLGWLGLTLERV